LQEIGPRFTLKLRSLKKGMPSVGGAFGAGEHPPGLEVDVGGDGEDGGFESGKTGDEGDAEGQMEADAKISRPTLGPSKGGRDEYEWMWKVRRLRCMVADSPADFVNCSGSPSWRRRGVHSFYDVIAGWFSCGGTRCVGTIAIVGAPCGRGRVRRV
jgi:hypothetical protein